MHCVAVFGERVSYVLTAGAARQDDAAEEPLVALRERRPLDVQLYWEAKLSKPLREVGIVEPNRRG